MSSKTPGETPGGSGGRRSVVRGVGGGDGCITTGASLGADGFHPLLDELLRAAGPEAAQRLEALAARLVVRREKVLDLVEQVAGEVLQRAQVAVVVRLCRD